MAEYVSTNQFVVCVWGTENPPSNIEAYVAKLKEKAGDDGIVRVENANMLPKSNHDRGTFDIVLSGRMSDDAGFLHSDEILAEILKILKPNGVFYLSEPKEERSAEKLQSKLTLTGFTSITEVEKTGRFSQIKCLKPNFEVGKSSKLSFGKKSTKSEVANIWTLSANDANDDDIDIIDSDALLDDNDLKKPDFSGVITDCGTSKAGKRRACKGCTCGLKEELSGAPAPAVKSACGSCYLGDAFRCASCPYLGMAPFKPGDQVTLSDRQLNPDI